MDFDLRDDSELEAFRTTVRAWLSERVTPEARAALDGDTASPQLIEWASGFQRDLAARGWAVPSWPREYGGGGLTPDHDTVVGEELAARNMRSLYENNLQVAAAVMAWGGDAQRRRFLPPLLRGDLIAWRSVNEADAVSDPESVDTRADKDGDVYIVNGGQPFYGEPGDPSLLWTLAVTYPDAPAHLRLAAFLIPPSLPGVALSSADSLVEGQRRFVTMTDVQVPVEYRIGADGDGWAAAQSSLETESEADRTLEEQRVLVTDLVHHTKTTLRGRQPLFRYKHVRQKVVEAYIQTQVLRLLSIRNRWIRSEGQETSYHGPQYALMAKAAQLKLAATMLETMGPYSLLADGKWGPMEGRAEAYQRASLPGAKPGESIAVQERLTGSRLGLERNGEATESEP